MDGLNKVYNETCLETIEKLASKSINCVITSPPYWQQRDYGSPDQWGLEPTYQEFLQHLWQMMDGLHRILRDDGTVFINLGDTYGGSGKRQPHHKARNSMIQDNDRMKQVGFGIGNTETSKCMLMLPARFAIGCSERGWLIRNDLIWGKKNTQPESVVDRFSKKHEHIFFFTKQENYFFDLDSIRDTHKANSIRKTQKGRAALTGDVSFSRAINPGDMLHDLGRNPGDVLDFWDNYKQAELQDIIDYYESAGDLWKIATANGISKSLFNAQEHFATFNHNLIKKPLLAGCPEFVCNRCGTPRKKIYKVTSTNTKRETYGEQPNGVGHQTSTGWIPPTHEMIGYTDCGCKVGFRPGVVYDPFMGSGTTAKVAIANGRAFIGSEVVKKNCDIVNRNMGFFINEDA